MRVLFYNISGCPEEEKIKSAYKKMIKENHRTQEKLSIELKKNIEQHDKLCLEIGKALIGESIYSSDDLSVAIQTLKDKIEASKKHIEELKVEDNDKKSMSESIIPAYKQFRSWAAEFEFASFEAKKMIVVVTYLFLLFNYLQPFQSPLATDAYSKEIVFNFLIKLK